jgi:ABC-type bacteriocin/lantibiotic exporter with double-glycine peptidase domain
MERLAAGRTTFLIAHRSSTLAQCDRWVELRGGMLVEGDVGLPEQRRSTREVPWPTSKTTG